MEKRYSYLWNFFAVTDASSYKAVCYLCNHVLSYRTTITNLKKHLLTRHPEIEIKPNSIAFSDDIAEILNKSADNINSPIIKNDTIKEKKAEKRPVDSPADSSIVKLRKAETDFIFPRKMNTQAKRHVDNALLSLFTKDLQRFALIEDKGFREFVTALNSQYEIPDIYTVSETLIPDMYEKLKQHVEDALQDGFAVTISIDTWTSNHNEHFVAIKANFLDGNFDVMSVLLDCYSFSEQLTYEKLHDIVVNVTNEWCIINKITLIIYNCICDNLNGYQMPCDSIICIVHSINIIVANSLECISNLLIKVLNIVSCYKQNKFAMAELQRNQENLGLVPESLILSNTTDWYSVFLMLKRFVDLEDFVKTTLCHLDVSLTFLTKEEWDICREIVEIIKPFETFVKSLHEEKYLTSSLAIILAKGLETMLHELAEQSFHEMTSVVLKQCIEETFQHFSFLYNNNKLLISTFLDPRFKDVIFEANVKEDLKQSISNIVSANVVPSKEQNSFNQQDTSSENDSLSIWKAFQSKASECRPQCSKKNSRASIEIQQYLDDGLLPRNENPMQWWKINGHMYPQLKNLMKEHLATTCTAASCDTFFSSSAQILNQRRSNLTIDEAKMVLFINSNQYLMKMND